MDPVSEIFAAFGDSPLKLSKATGLAIQTVCDWRRKGSPNIPKWRRAGVLDAAKREGIQLSDSAIHYLASDQQPAVSAAAA